MRPRTLALVVVLALLPVGCGGPSEQPAQSPKEVSYSLGPALSCPTADLTYFDFQNCEDPTGTVRTDCGQTEIWWTWSLCKWDCASVNGAPPQMVYLWFVDAPSGWALVHDVRFACAG